MENDGSFVPQFTVLISPGGIIYQNLYCELLDTRIFGLVFEGSWCRHWKYFPMENDGSFGPQFTVLISPEVLFTRMYSVNYLIREYLDWFLKVTDFDTEKYLTDGERWQLRSPSVTVLISPEIRIYRNEFCELLDTRIFGLVFEGSWC